MEPPPIFSNGTFVTCLSLAFFIDYLCHAPPNASPTRPYRRDRIETAKIVSWNTWIVSFLALVRIYHLCLALFPTYSSSICPHSYLLNEDLFTWSTRSVLYITVVLAFGMVRLAAYAKLGKNFTFELAVPSGLVTTGLYRYIQHPSYLALLTLRVADFLFVDRLDGVAACALPERIVRVKGLGGVLTGLVVAVVAYGISLRVKDEEEMLREEFGKEWEAWHGKTKRFIPWIW